METLASGAWATPDRIRRTAIMMLVAFTGALGWQWLGGQGTFDPLGRPIGTDFSGVYSAGKMALSGQAADAWVWPLHHRAQEIVHQRAGVVFLRLALSAAVPARRRSFGDHALPRRFGSVAKPHHGSMHRDDHSYLPRTTNGIIGIGGAGHTRMPDARAQRFPYRYPARAWTAVA